MQFISYIFWNVEQHLSCVCIITLSLDSKTAFSSGKKKSISNVFFLSFFSHGSKRAQFDVSENCHPLDLITTYQADYFPKHRRNECVAVSVSQWKHYSLFYLLSFFFWHVAALLKQIIQLINRYLCTGGGLSCVYL
jgi:hypothetical protein